ncbi:MAG: GNAT family N-acetyltransferase [Marinosulfonomonas sp.]|nr:MAG: GNAT family N-acetyltransferase [Marinosulfonomonas sp.]
MNNRDINEAMHGWSTRARPNSLKLEGHYTRLENLSAATHAAEIHAVNVLDESIWDYLYIGPYASEAEYRAWVESVENSADPVFLAIYDKEQNGWLGVATFMRIVPEMGVIEVGNINFSPPLQRTRAATEAMYLMMNWAFEAGYRRYEWKCNALNMPSRRAAERLGFSFEGVFRQHLIVKGHNRDTAWYAVIDKDWPAVKAMFETWLTPENFDAEGQQKLSLRALTEPLLFSRDPVLT